MGYNGKLAPHQSAGGAADSFPRGGSFFTFKAFPRGGEGGPAGPDEGRVCRGFPFMGYNGKPAPHQSAGGAADSFPRGGKVAPQGRMRGRVCRGFPFMGYNGKPAPHQSAGGAADSFPRGGSFFTFKAFPRGGEGGPAGPDEGRVCRGFPFMGYNGKPAPHQSAGGAADSFPRGGKVAPQGRMRGRVCRGFPFMGYNGKPAPHQSAGGAADSFPRGGSLFTLRKKRSARRSARRHGLR